MLEARFKICVDYENELTSCFDCDANSVDAGVIHLFDGTLSVTGILVLNECVSALVRELDYRAKSFELILEVVAEYFTFQTTDIDLRIRVTHFRCVFVNQNYLYYFFQLF